MEYKSISCTSLVNKITKTDALFIGDYSVDPYQNCEFGCRYCDSSFEKTIYIKSNAIQIFKQEIENLLKGVIIVGSVHDPYQKAEKEYKITRNLLKVIEEHKFPCHILTKSDLILRDINILKKIEKCIVTISVTTLDKYISDIFEEEVPSPEERLKIVETLSKSGIKTGLAIIPVLPYIVDEELEKIVKSAHEHMTSYILHKYLELKGDQKTLYYKTIKENFPHLLSKYRTLYGDSYIPNKKYISELNSKMDQYYKKYEISNKI
jgi:DNA repair photolyase